MKIPILPEPPAQVFSLATPAHVLAKLAWEIGALRKLTRRSNRGLFDHLHASYLAFNTAVTAWHLCDWIWHSWSEEEQEIVAADLKMPNAVASQFRGTMAGICRELKICQQIANGSKHMRLERPDERIRAGMKWEVAEKDGGYKFSLVVWDGDVQRDALEVYDAAFEFWRRQLSTWGFIEDQLIG